MMKNIEIYRPSMNDVEGLFNLERLCFPSPWDIGEVQALINREPVVFTAAAFSDSSPVGYISASFCERRTLHVFTLCVHPEQRRKGTGRDLLLTAMHWGRHMGAEKVQLEVRAENEAASGLYAQAGFIVQETLPNFYGQGRDGIRMVKPLVPFQHALRVSQFLHNHLESTPVLGVILGSGLGWVTERFGTGQSIPFRNIPGMAGEAVQGHSHTLQLSSNGKIAFLMGRRHHYQGYTGPEIALLPSALAAIGVGNWVLTSSAGAVDPSYSVGDAMLFTDHINFSGCIPDQSEQFIGHNVYSRSLMVVADQCKGGFRKGIFACVSGPAYETASEVSLIKECGASAVSMSTVQEALALRSLGCRVLAVALITNSTESGDSVCHEEVLSAQDTVRTRQENSLIQLLERLSL